MLLCNKLPGAVIPMTVALLQVGLVRGQSKQHFHHEKQSQMLCCLASAVRDARQHLRLTTEVSPELSCSTAT